MKPYPLMGEGWVGVMPGERTVLKLAPMGAEGRPLGHFRLLRNPPLENRGRVA
jgi:hypothetical protein